MKYRLASMAIVCGLLFAACRTPQPPMPEVVTTLSGMERIDKDGGLHFDITAGAFLTNGFSVSDTVVVALAGNEVSMPVVIHDSQVASGEFALVASHEPSHSLCTTILNGDAATRLGIAHRLTTASGDLQMWLPVSDLVFPLPVTIRLEKKGDVAITDESELNSCENLLE